MVDTVIELPSSLKGLRRMPLPHKLGVLERLFGKSLSRHGICWVEASNKIIWKLDLADVCQRWIVYGDYEGSSQMEWIRRWLSGGGVVIDSGANIGQMLLFLAPLPKVRILAFEPLPYASEWLQECLSRYSDWQVTVENCGLSSRKEIITLQIHGSRSTMQMDWYGEKNLPTLAIPVTTLDKFLWESGIETVRFWKLDVEGHELQALRGAEWHLRNRRIEALLVEISGTGDVPQFLANCGYDMFEIRSGRIARIDDISTSSGNVLALPKVASATI